MIKIAKLATAHMFDENNPEDSDYELWKGIAEYMDGEDAYVVESTAMEGKYVFLGLCDGNKDKELAYMMEQDSMTGVFIDDQEGFEAAWESKEYEHEGCFCIEPKWIEALTHLGEQNEVVDYMAEKKW